jgi:hypothetical protein
MGYWMNSAPGTQSKGAVIELLDEEQESAGRIESWVEALHAQPVLHQLDKLESGLRRARVDARRAADWLEVTVGGSGRARENLLLGVLLRPEESSGAAVLAQTAVLLSQAHLDYTVRCYWIASPAGVEQIEQSLGARNEGIRGWLVLGRLGRFAERGATQHWPWFAASFQEPRADTVLFESGIGSRGWLETIVGEFRLRSKQPSAALSAPESWLSMGETAWMRSPQPHVHVSDSGIWRGTQPEAPECLDVPAMARIAHGLAASATALARRNRLKL